MLKSKMEERVTFEIRLAQNRLERTSLRLRLGKLEQLSLWVNVGDEGDRIDSPNRTSRI